MPDVPFGVPVSWRVAGAPVRTGVPACDAPDVPLDFVVSWRVDGAPVRTGVRCDVPDVVFGVWSVLEVDSVWPASGSAPTIRTIPNAMSTLMAALLIGRGCTRNASQ